VVLRRRFREQTPSERTIARILRRAQLVRAKRKRRPRNIVERAPEVEAHAPNDVWTVAFKGWWLSADGRRCEPLTVRDAFSRFLFTVVLCASTTQDVRRIFEQLFRKYGIPRAIQCDNGGPFISVRPPGGLSRLSAWWVSLGIRIVRSRLACPQDNGGHERMHRDISQEVQVLPANTKALQQRVLDRWRQEFNHVRPHEALDGKTPAEVYTSATKAPTPRPEVSYPPGSTLVKVYRNGTFRYATESYAFSVSLSGHVVALEPVTPLQMRVWFHELDLGLIEVAPVVLDSVYTQASTQTKTEAA
jgi:transposase InsO family protein